jgi:hypothetical protein
MHAHGNGSEKRVDRLQIKDMLHWYYDNFFYVMLLVIKILVKMLQMHDLSA